MALTGIIYRRDTKSNLIAIPPIPGEVVFSTDTEEYGAFENNVIVWRKHISSSFTQAQADLLYQPLNSDIVIDGAYVHTDNNYTDLEKDKLSNIEDNATADMTEEEINAFNLDASTFDTLTSSQFLRSDIDGTLSGNLVVTGTLLVQGSTTIINSSNLLIADNLLTINYGTTGLPSTSAGIEVERGDLSNVSILWNESSDTWTLSNDGINYFEIITTDTDTGNIYSAGYALALNGLEFSHLTDDGYGHVPVTGDTSLGKVLTAGNTAGVYTWEVPADTYGSWIISDNEGIPNSESVLSGDIITFAGNGATTTLYTSASNTLTIQSNDTVYIHPNHTGDVVSVGDGTTTIQSNVVTLDKFQQIATQTILGRNTTGTGNIEILNKTTILSMLNVQDGAEVNVQSDWNALSGDAFILNKPADPGDGTINIIAGSGLSTGGTFTVNQVANADITLIHADTSTQNTVTNTNANVIQSVSLDEFGHITLLGSTEVNMPFLADVKSDMVPLEGQLLTYNGTSSEWESRNIDTPSIFRDIFYYTSTIDQTDFSGLDDYGNTLEYNVSSLMVIIDGWVQQESDYIATNGTSISFNLGCNIGDQIMIIAYSNATITDAVKLSGDTMTGDLVVPNLTVTDTLTTDTLTTVNINNSDTVNTLDLIVTGTLTETSALKYKENIIPLENSLQKINLLQGVKYNKIGFINDEIGLIADEVDLVIPEVVTKIDNKIEGIHYARLTALLIEAVKELSDENNTLKKINKNFDDRLRILEGS